MIENNAMFKLSYGLFLLSAKLGGKDNACIINTAIQLTDNPKRISIAVNKANLTHDIIFNTNVFNLSVLSTSVPFELFQRFGFNSGHKGDKMEGFNNLFRSENGLTYLSAFANAFISAKVTQKIDLDTHTLFIADVTEAKVLSSDPSVTYTYYFENIKPKPQPKKTGWTCKICGYHYDGDVLPEDFVCPICKHGSSDFEKDKA